MRWKRHGRRPEVPRDPISPPLQAVEEAKAFPGGMVAEIPGSRYGPSDEVPIEAIKGFWRVGDDGVILDRFEPNPRYRPAAGGQ